MSLKWWHKMTPIPRFFLEASNRMRLAEFGILQPVGFGRVFGLRMSQMMVTSKALNSGLILINKNSKSKPNSLVTKLPQTSRRTTMVNWLPAGYDTVRSYFAMRKFSMIRMGNYSFFGLNNKPYFLTGVLDQGYWPESGMTPPSEAA